jgi:hypothetical protein
VGTKRNPSSTWKPFDSFQVCVPREPTSTLRERCTLVLDLQAYVGEHANCGNQRLLRVFRYEESGLSRSFGLAQGSALRKRAIVPKDGDGGDGFASGHLVPEGDDCISIPEAVREDPLFGHALQRYLGSWKLASQMIRSQSAVRRASISFGSVESLAPIRRLSPNGSNRDLLMEYSRSTSQADGWRFCALLPELGNA